MYKLILLLLLCCFSSLGNSQLNPSGLALNIEGKLMLVDFYEASNDEEYDVLSGDTVFFVTTTLEGKQVTGHRDFQFLKQRGFEILQAGDPQEADYVIPDPNDTNTYYPTYSPYFLFPYTSFVLDTNLFYVNLDTTIHREITAKKQFEDEIVYTGTMDKNDSLEVKTSLKDYILKRSGLDIDYDYFYELRNKLSENDSVVDNQVVSYDYLVSKCTFHTYSKDKLINSMSYYYLSGGIENDSISYNSKGNIIYLKRESVGITMTKIYIDYDKRQRVTKIKTENYSYNSEYFDACPNCLKLYSSEEQTFNYKKGLISSMITKNIWGKDVTEHRVDLTYGDRID